MVDITADPTLVSGRRITVPAILLDDYEPTQKGYMAITFGAGYGKVRAGRDIAMPFADIHIGLAPRLDFGIYTSLANTQFDTFKTTAVGDTYASMKLVLIRETKNLPGLTFEPVLEVLGRPSLAENVLAPNKVNGAFGGIIGKRLGESFRIYNHSGYFTRGIVFSSTAFEIDRFSRITPTLFAGYGSLTANRDLAASLQLNSSRPDVGGSIGFRLSKGWSGYVSVSRSIGRRDDNSNDISIGGGLTYAWRFFGE